MQETLNLLRQLQDFDMEIQEINGRTDLLQGSLDELYALHTSLKESLDAQKQQLDETRALMRDKEIELETNADRYKQSKAKLGQVSNTREYNALEKEMDALKKMRAQLEEEHESLREAVEGFEADVTEKEEKTSELNKQIKEEESVIEEARSKAESKTKKLVKKRDQLKAKIPKNVYRRYQFIASRRPGAAVAAARDMVCTGCHMLVPPQLFNELQVGRKLIQCQSCQRILYYEDSDAAGAEA